MSDSADSAEGRVKNQCKMLLDSGADSSVIRPSVIYLCEWLGQHITLKGVFSESMNSYIPLVVTTLDKMQDKVLIGRDIGPVFTELSICTRIS